MGEHEVQVFNVLVHVFGKMLTKSEVEKMKKELKGYISQENLAQVKSGIPLMALLMRCGFLRENKLMFFKKILNNSNLVEAESILEEYMARRKTTSLPANYEKAFINKKTQSRIDALEESIQRGYVGIKYKKEVLQYENEETDEKELAMDKLRKSIKVEEKNLESIAVQRKSQEDEMKKLKDLYEEVSNLISQNDRKKSKLIEEISNRESEIKELEIAAKRYDQNALSFDFYKDAIEKVNQTIERLRKEILNIAKERERLDRKLDRIDERQDIQSDAMRLTDLEKMAKLDQIMKLEGKLVQAREDFREHLRKVYKIELEIVKLEGTVEENVLEKERTSRQGLIYQSEHLMKAYRRIQQKLASKNFQVLDYGNLDEFDSYTFGESGSRLSPLQFKSPINVAFNINGDLLILDKGNKRVVCTDIVGNDARLLINFGNVFEAVDMVVNHKGQLLLASNSLIKVFNEAGQILFQFLPNLEPNDELPKVTGIAVNVKDEIFVCDAANRKIQLFSETGDFLQFIRLDETFYSPNKLVVIGTSEIIVGDDVDNNLKVMEASRDHLTKPKQIGNEGLSFCEFITPLSLALDSDNNVLITDSGNHRIQVLDNQKDIIAEFGKLGSRPGCLDKPSAVAVHPYGVIAVADTCNDRIVIFS